jgi:hypothetical protein
MGCDYGYILFIGVKLLSKKELFDEVPDTQFGCPHKITDSAYCPICGQKASRTFIRDVPKVPLGDEWFAFGRKPVLDGRFFVHAELEYEPHNVYVGVYSNLEYVPGSTTTLPAQSVSHYLLEAANMVDFLIEHNIRYEGSGPSVFVIPYISC